MGHPFLSLSLCQFLCIITGIRSGYGIGSLRCKKASLEEHVDVMVDRTDGRSLSIGMYTWLKSAPLSARISPTFRHSSESVNCPSLKVHTLHSHCQDVDEAQLHGWDVHRFGFLVCDVDREISLQKKGLITSDKRLL